MAIYSVLRHRASVYRAQKNLVTGDNEWSAIRTNLPCLLSDNGAEREESTSEVQRPADRVGVLFVAPTADITTGDRIAFTRGPTGNYLVKPDAATVVTPAGAHHRELHVEQVS